MAVVTMRQLLESGVHFGHQTRRWNPKMKRFIMTERNGIYIIDLQQSVDYINSAYEFVKQTVAHGGSILFVGTKKQAQEPIADQATRVGMPYVNHRWLGGMLTNFQTISKRLDRMKELEQLDFDNPAASGYTKKELLLFKRELDKLSKSLGGVRDMAKVPSAVWIVDTKKEHLAVDEARKLGLPVIAILDTNCDPDEVDYKIPGNDDAIRSVTLLTRVIADAVAEGLMARSGAKTGEQVDEEPMAEWERELLAGAGGRGGRRGPRGRSSCVRGHRGRGRRPCRGGDRRGARVGRRQRLTNVSGAPLDAVPPFRRRDPPTPRFEPDEKRSELTWRTTPPPTSRSSVSSPPPACSTSRRPSTRPTATWPRRRRSSASRARRA